MMGIFLFVILIRDSLCLNNNCPPAPQVPDDLVELPFGESKQGEKFTRLLLEGWKRSKRRRGRDVSKESSIIASEAESKANSGLNEETEVRSKRQAKRRRRIKRKEYRQMGRREMKRWKDCLEKMKEAGIMEELADVHLERQSPGAHFGVAFLPWHRVYLWLFEKEMRKLPNCSIAYIPYWDSSLDRHLPVAHHSVIWMDEFFGNANGTVVSGLGANWEMPTNCRGIGRYLKRTISESGSALYSRQEIVDIQAPKTFKDLTIQAVSNQVMLENSHNSQHCYFDCSFLGSHIGDLTCAPMDPAFWMLHSMVDYIWWEWNQQRPNRTMIYPEPGVDGVSLSDMSSYDPDVHLADAEMKPFKTRRGEAYLNRDGLKRRFRAHYRTRPSKDNCLTDEDCGSRMLYCTDNCECSSKVRPGGRCDMLPVQACYCHKKTETPRCRNNICSCIASD